MLHKLFQWRHLKRRKGTNPSLRGVQHRSASRDLVQYVKDFAGKEGSNLGIKRRMLRKIVKAILFCGFVILVIWFAKNSYAGLQLLD